jgi:iron complex outermembrane receptor protein
MSKYALMGSVAVCATVMALSSAAFAQDQSAPGDSRVSEITVTGSRIIPDGTDAPTPVEVVGAAQIQNQAVGNIAEVLNLQPAFAGNTESNSQTQTSNASASLVGINSVSLRGLGTNRTLVLMDGQRFTPTLTYGSVSTFAVDINAIPQQLVQRVETVTGGASAVYGSDAIGGAVNFILDKKFTGLKVDASGGETTYGDDANEKLDITYGTRFAGDKGHFILSGSTYSNDGVHNTTNRAWDHSTWCTMSNPNWSAAGIANPGQPQRLTENNCGDTGAPGGVIANSAAKGTTFGVGGTPLPFTYGSLVAVPAMVGGSIQLSNADHLTKGDSLDPSMRQQNVFSLLSYDLTNRIKATYEFSWAHTSSYSFDPDLFYDSGTGVGTLSTNNAFLPSSVRSVIVNGLPPSLANPLGIPGQTTFTLSTLNGDLPDIQSFTSRTVTRHSVALDGDFDLFKSNWVWNAYATYGKTRNLIEDFSISRSRYTAAINAVVGPTGAIVCSNGDPTCVPFDVFGLGVNSPQAIGYLEDVGKVNQTNTQEVAAASLTGHPFALWAGPIGVALSTEYRFDSASGVSNAEALANDLYSGNYKPINGHDSVVEGALEIAIPLARDFFLAKAADLDLAVRETGYSTSGDVTTWKVGATYSPILDLTFRGNVSHDIRAANLGELYAFAGAPVVTPGLLDQFTGNSSFIARVSSTGNPNLAPETANSQGIGAVYKPSFVPGFSMSLDYWKTDVHGEITSLSGTQAIQECFAGNAQACGFITRQGPATLPGIGAFAGQNFAPIAFIATSYVNIANVNSSGLDEFLAYRFPLKSIVPFFDGNMTLRYDGSYYFKAVNNPGLPGSLPNFSAPYWRGNLTSMYEKDNWTFGLTARYASKNTYIGSNLPQTIVCGMACPASSSLPANFTTTNFILGSSTLYFDLNAARSFTVKGADAQLYLNIRNLFNRSPLITGIGSEPYAGHQSSVGGDDTLGRIIRVGLRVKM